VFNTEYTASSGVGLKLLGAREVRSIAMAAGKVYSFEEVRPHADRKDCWLIINGKVVSISWHLYVLVSLEGFVRGSEWI
jgi:cytochrome b involved in lipid metabolism